MAISIVFLHGLESGPGGQKVQHLEADPRYCVTAPELPTRAAIDHLRNGPSVLPSSVAEKPLAVAEAAIEQGRPDVVVGSSYGGGVAAALAARGTYGGPLVLLAPAAAKLFAVTALPRRQGRVVIVHGRGDEVVPPRDSVELAERSFCDVLLFLIDDGHRLQASVAAGLMDRAIALAL